MLIALVWGGGTGGAAAGVRRCADNVVQCLHSMFEKLLPGYLSLLALVTPDPDCVVY